MAVAFLLAMWLALTILRQFLPLRRVRTIDRFQLIADWKLFEANTEFSRSDLHLLWRQVLPEGSLSEWSEIWPSAPRGVASSLFNPELRLRKWLIERGQNVKRPRAYSALRDLVASKIQAANGKEGQFSLVLGDRTIYISCVFGADCP